MLGEFYLINIFKAMSMRNWPIEYLPKQGNSYNFITLSKEVQTFVEKVNSGLTFMKDKKVDDLISCQRSIKSLLPKLSNLRGTSTQIFRWNSVSALSKKTKI